MIENLLDWARAEIACVERTTPLALHSQYGDRKDWGSGAGLIRGLPFSRQFLGRLDGGLPPSRLADAARRIESAATTRTERKGADIVCYVVAGQTDPEMLRRKLRLSETEFRMAALCGLSTLKREIESPRQREDLARMNDQLAQRQRMMMNRQATPSPTA